MQLIRPVTIDDTVLTSSNVPESKPVWASGTTYALGAQVRGQTTPTQHRLFECVQASNQNHDPTTDDGTWWIPAGATNRWRMFDVSVTSQTSNMDSIEVELTSPGRVDSLALLNLDAAEATVTMTDAIDGVVFQETYPLVSPSGIIDWYAYFFEPIERMTDLVVTGMPPYAGATVSVELMDTGSMSRCGALVLGQSKIIGTTIYGATVGIKDFSRKEQNAFGDYAIVERAFSKRASFTVWIERGLTDQVQTLLAKYRAVPIVYVGSQEYGSTVVFGFFRDFNIELAYQDYSICSLDLEGLT